jgi:hypothetical protein
VTAADPDAAEGDALSYAWERNGLRVGAGPEPALALHEPKDGDEVRVTVTDRAGLSAGSRVWTLAVPPAAVANRSPRITGQSPTAARVTLEQGESREFSVRAADPDEGDRLVYAWSLDGKKVGGGSSWTLSAPTDAGPRASLDLEAEVADVAGLTDSRKWTVEIAAARPRITAYEPRAPEITLTPGETRALSVRAAGGRAGARVRYAWTLDGKAFAGATGEQVSLPNDLAPGSRHTVQVVVVDERDLRSDPRRWSVVVEELREVAGITEAEARDWLARYRSAFERNDKGPPRTGCLLDAGRGGGVRGWGPRTVTIRNEAVERQGQSATVSFDRTDRDLERRTDAMYPNRIRYRLEKGPGGVRATHR